MNLYMDSLVLSTLRLARCCQHDSAGPWSHKLTLIVGSKWWSLLMAGDEMFMSLSVTPKTTEQRI